MTRVVRAVWAAAAMCLLAGCGVRPTGVVSAGEAPTATATSLPKAQVYFFRDDALEAVERSVPPWDIQAVFDALQAGPTPQERERGLRTRLSAGLTIRAIGTRAVFVEFRRRMTSKEVDGYLQVVCTARMLPGAPFVKPPDSADPIIEKKLMSQDLCPADGGPAGAPSPEPLQSSPAEPSPEVIPPEKVDRSGRGPTFSPEPAD
ncbi:hypothetical protein NE235_31420 [Actinoallomurus spadix]|uniref:Lipoprotein n=1 Tax=Actinoallomurus spadix TaxID=79912 RepID=A0ABN0W7X5_9ACTN|nr:hypothetical protein [Actinoallomurus spadix]MCO5990630.1 hypothetical protein [Actinoallomurus spadix]